jgi:rubrerythrin
MDFLRALRTLERLERKLAELYAWFGELYTKDEDAAFVFHRMYLEERSHVSLVEYQRRLARANPSAFGDVDADLAGVEEAIARIEAFRGNGQSPELVEAIRFALELEASAAKSHLRGAVRESSPDMARLMGSLGRADRQHAGSLRQLAESRGLVVA